MFVVIISTPHARIYSAQARVSTVQQLTFSPALCNFLTRAGVMLDQIKLPSILFCNINSISPFSTCCTIYCALASG